MNELHVFDLDGTLIDGDCAMIWNEFLVEKGVISQPNFIEEDRRLMGLYAQAKLDMEAYLDFSMSPIITVDSNIIDDLVHECIETKIVQRIFPEALKRIESLKNAGTTMTLVSASVSFLVEPIARMLGIGNAIGIDLKISLGCYSASIDGVPSYQDGKVTRLQSWLLEQDERFDEIYFYTDSINDLPMCLFADYVYLVNPCQKLAQYSNTPNWQRLNWVTYRLNPKF